MILLELHHSWLSNIYSFLQRCEALRLHVYRGLFYGTSQRSAPKSHGLDLLDQMQKRVVSLVGFGLSSDLQAQSHRWDVANLSHGLLYNTAPNVAETGHISGIYRAHFIRIYQFYNRNLPPPPPE